jgi:translation initiation factor eIF-2B subunit beta
MRFDREVQGAFAVGTATAKLFIVIVQSWRESRARELMKLVREVGYRIEQAQPMEFTIGSMTRRVLTSIREAYELARKEKEQRKKGDGQVVLEGVGGVRSLATYLTDDVEDFSKHFDVKQHVVQELDDLVTEMQNSYQVIAEQAEQHIHTNEVIMTYGRSRTVLEFLMAAKFRKFEVIVAESAPSQWGKTTAKKLAAEGISTTLISDSAVFALMARVNKVIVGTHAVMANGGLISHTGLHMMALAAKHHSVPVVVCSGLYKLCPLYAFDQDTFQDHNSPAAVLPFNESEDATGIVDVVNPAYDYIPPELVSIFVTNQGGHPPTYIYRLLAEYYHLDDYNLKDE